MGNSLFREIQRKRTINIIVASLAVLILAVSGYFLFSKVFRAYADPVDVSGDNITFNSGYYTIDSSGNVYAKTGSEIADTPDDIFPFVSYLSDAYLDGGSQLNIFNKNVTVTGTATVLMEGHQTFSDLTLGTGGTITQPQPDRAGNINRYQYSDHEWAIEFLGFVKVPDGETRKVTCATDYDTGDGGNPIGNGCLIQYHPTETNLDDIGTADWTDLDKVWQTGAAAFTTTRYGALGSITNASGSDKYYPVRVIFKDDYMDNRDENMEVYLRNAAGTIVDQAGVDISAESPNSIEFANGTIYGATSSGTVDITASGESRFQYYLLDEYVATPASPTLGWISDDLTDAYKTYTNNEITLSSFFNDSYGEDQDGFFDLKFDDNTAWDGIYASSPFAKGTIGVMDEEAYKNFAYSAKTINPNISAGSGLRYESLGLDLTITSGNLNFNGGIIDLEGKGYPGYSYEVRTQAETSTFRTNSGSGPLIDSTIYGGGDTADVLAQAGAHTKNGGGYNSNTYGGGANTAVYDSIDGPIYAGSGGGSSGSATISSHGGNGGGYLRISANNIEINSTNTSIRTDGDGGYQVASGSDYFAGGSGGSVYITASTLDKNVSYASGQYFAEADGGFDDSGTGYTGGSGGLIRIVMADFQLSGSSSSDISTLVSAVSMARGDGYAAAVTFGVAGERYIVISADAINTLTLVNPTKRFTVGGESATSVQVGDIGQLTVTVDGVLDEIHTSPGPLDLILLCDRSDSMDFHGKLETLKSAASDLINNVIIRNNNDEDIRLGYAWFHHWSNGSSLTSDETTLNSYKDAINAWDTSAQTAVGKGLIKAENLLSDSSSDNRRKFIILITDGHETVEPYVTGHQLELPAAGPDSGSPLYNIVQREIGLVSVGIGVNTPVGDFLDQISDYAKPVDYAGTVSYDVGTNAEGLSEVLLGSLNEMASQTAGMGFAFREVLPPGISLEDVTVSGLKINGIDYTGDISSLCSEALVTTIDAEGNNINRTKVECTTNSSMYDSSLYGNTNYNSYQFNFIFDINFKKADTGLVDLDQNAICSIGSAPAYKATPDSFVTYSPVGSYLGQTRARTDAYCLSIIPQITIKKILKPFIRPGILDRFNPYSVMKGDKLLVEITASPIVPGVQTTIKDQLMQNSEYVCLPELKAGSLLSSTADQTTKSRFTFYAPAKLVDNVVVFENFILKPGIRKAKFKYICELKKP